MKNTPILDAILSKLAEFNLREPGVIPSHGDLKLSGRGHSDFINTLQEIAESDPIRLNQSLSDLIWWLETNYQGNGTYGVSGALTDFCTGELAVDEVSEIWLESIHTSQATSLQTWAINSVIDPTDWEQCLKLTSEILGHYQDLLRPEIRVIPPAILAANIKDLLAQVIYLHENAILK